MPVTRRTSARVADGELTPHMIRKGYGKKATPSMDKEERRKLERELMTSPGVSLLRRLSFIPFRFSSSAETSHDEFAARITDLPTEIARDSNIAYKDPTPQTGRVSKKGRSRAWHQRLTFSHKALIFLVSIIQAHSNTFSPNPRN